MKSVSKHALVIPLFGELCDECLDRLRSWVQQGFWVVVVNNNPAGSSLNGVVANTVVPHHNRHGLAGGFNDGVDSAIADGADRITLVDQDSVISTDSLVSLGEACGPGLVVGPQIVDEDRHSEHTAACDSARLLISSGTTFEPGVWEKIGPFQSWMEIDYIDHEWCSRARRYGIYLKVITEATLFQSFGSRHPNVIAHMLGLQLYSPYRRAIALRNLRWLLTQSFVPLDIRLKELIKMLVKPWFWLALEPNRRRCLAVLLLGLTAPLNRPFPRHRLETLR